MGDYSLHPDYDSYEHSDTSEDICADITDVDIKPQTQNGRARILNKTDIFYTNGSTGMATCEMCGKVGVKHAFYSKSKRFCSLACSRAFSGRKKAGRPSSIKKMVKAEFVKKVPIIAVQDVQPWKEGTFQWNEYLINHDVPTAPVSAFKHCPLSTTWDGIHNGMKVEVINTQVQLPKVVYWIATVIKIAGYKALLCYEGFDSYTGHDFWVNLCSKDIHEVGWCANTGNSLVPPTAIKDKYSDLKEFLVKRLIGSRTLPPKFYDTIQNSINNHKFEAGMKVEVINKTCVSAMRVAVIEEVIGGRLHLQYDNQSEYDDFWCHMTSSLVHEVGWAERIGHKLQATDSYRESCATKNALNDFDKEDSTADMFPKVPALPVNAQFEVGMKLEAIDPLNLSSICVSTITKVLKDNYLMICIDRSTEVSGTDWFCYHSSSPALLPAGFCEINNIELTPPKGYTKNTFHWENYLRVTQSIAAPVRLFDKELRNHGLKVGMKVEAVDLMDPRLICVGTIVQVIGRLLRIHFDGWETDYDQWIDCEAPDLFPIGWCDLMNYPLEGPRLRDNQTDLSSVSRKRKTKIQGSQVPKKRRKKVEREDSNPVMYAGGDNNGIVIKTEPTSPSQGESSDALIDPLCGSESQDSIFSFGEPATIKQEPIDPVITSSKPFNICLAASRPALAATLLSPSLSPTKTTAPIFTTTTSSVAIKAVLSRSGVDKTVTSRSPGSSVKVVTHIPRFLVVDSDKTSSSLLTKTTSTSTGVTPRPPTQLTQSIVPELWSIYNVCQFLKINDCGSYCDSFSRKGIDGKKLLQLSKEQIASLTGMKVGPSLKVFELIQQLKSKITDSGSGAVRDAVNLQQS